MATFLAKGINFAIGDGGSPTEHFNQIIHLTTITPSGSKWATEDTTSHDSSTPVKTLAPTLRDDGTFALTFIYDASDVYQAQLDNLSVSGAKNNFQITYPGGSIGSFSFSGYCVDFKLETTVSGLVIGNATVQVIGAITTMFGRIASVAFTDAYAGTYVTGNVMEVTVTYDEVVVVTNTPQVALAVHLTTEHANYASGSGTNILKFHYTVGSGDSATAGQFSVTSPIGLNSTGTINDMAGNPALLTFTPPVTTAYKVN